MKQQQSPPSLFHIPELPSQGTSQTQAPKDRNRSIVELLGKDSSKRLPQDIDFMLRHLSGNRFFVEVMASHGESLLKELLRRSYHQ